MSTITFPTTVDAVLDAAAMLIETRGLHKRNYCGPDNKNGPVCALGAVTAAATGKPDPGLRIAGCRVARDARTYLTDEFERLGLGKVYQWNDEPERTAEQVAEALRAAAEQYRRDGAR